MPIVVLLSDQQPVLFQQYLRQVTHETKGSHQVRLSSDAAYHTAHHSRFASLQKLLVLIHIVAMIGESPAQAMLSRDLASMRELNLLHCSRLFTSENICVLVEQCKGLATLNVSDLKFEMVDSVRTQVTTCAGAYRCMPPRSSATSPTTLRSPR